MIIHSERLKGERARQPKLIHVAGAIFGICAFVLWVLFTPELSHQAPGGGNAYIVAEMPSFEVPDSNEYTQVWIKGLKV